jgi:hypothetical protein
MSGAENPKQQQRYVEDLKAQDGGNTAGSVQEI